ncbi:Protein C06G3.9 [Aphelenchoides avenae]|nr:Protein C06G3.9 [Aphelenchus avenae]
MTTWADIQKLAADLQRVQLAEGAKKLSDGNCVELVSKLMAMGAIDIVVTTDSKEYVTKKHLVTEVRNECIASDGRAALTDLALRLNIELDHIENAAAVITKQSDSFVLCNGELISREHIDNLCMRLNAQLDEVGQLSTLQLTKQWDLPTDILHNYLIPELGRKIHAVRHDDQLYTQRFLGVQRTKLRAVLLALTKPVSLQSIFNHLRVSQQLFQRLWSELDDAKQVPGRVVGSKSSLKSLYVPRVYEDLVRTFVLKHFKDNGHFEINVAKKLSIADVAQYFKELLPKDEFNKLIVLPSSVVGQELFDELQQSVEEKMAAQQYCAVEEVLPQALTTLDDHDLEKVLAIIQKSHPTWRTLDNRALYDPAIVAKIADSLEAFVDEKAKNDAPNVAKLMKDGKSQPEATGKKANQDDEDDWASTKGGKKKGGKKAAGAGTKSKTAAASNAKLDTFTGIHIPRQEVVAQVKSSCALPSGLLDELVEEVENSVNWSYRDKIEKFLRAMEQAGSGDQRKSQEERRARLKDLYHSIVCFENGASSFEDSLEADLKQYLLKSACTDFANLVLSYVANVSDAPPTNAKVICVCFALHNLVYVQARDELIASVPEVEAREALSRLFTSLTELNLFHDAVAGLGVCSLMVKPPDKKTRSDFTATRASDLRTQLNSTADAPTGLLLAVLLAYAHYAQVAVYASGKFVAPLIKHLATAGPTLTKPVSADLIALLLEAQKQVVDLIKKKNATDEDRAPLDDNLTRIKNILECSGP